MPNNLELLLYFIFVILEVFWVLMRHKNWLKRSRLNLGIVGIFLFIIWILLYSEDQRAFYDVTELCVACIFAAKLCIIIWNFIKVMVILMSDIFYQKLAETFLYDGYVLHGYVEHR